jgi:shikimate kinase
MNVGYIGELLDKRKPSYERAADVIIATDDRDIEEIAEEIWEKTK